MKQRIISLKRCYIEDDKKKVQIGETTETAYTFQTDCLWKKLKHSASTEQVNTSVMKKMEQRFSNATKTFSQKEGRYIKLLNEEILKVRQRIKTNYFTTSEGNKASTKKGHILAK